MRIFVMCRDSVMRWAEVSVDAMHSLGHETGCYVWNRKPLRIRVAKSIHRLARSIGFKNEPFQSFQTFYNRQLLRHTSGASWDILLCIHSNLYPETIQALRNDHSNIKVVYWWGDVLTRGGSEIISKIATHVDLVCLSYQGDCERLLNLGYGNTYYFPFGISHRYHTRFQLSERDVKKFMSLVSFAGNYLPERGETIRFLNRHLELPVRVWGHRWRKDCSGVRAGGPLSLEDTLKVHACSKISLNIHHHMSNNGLNMRFYEIPAAGGFQLCNWQPLVEQLSPGSRVVTYKDHHDLLEKVRYYLNHEDERRAIAERIKLTMLREDSYEQRFRRMLNHLRDGHRGLVDRGTGLGIAPFGP